ncbi:hypothetical protein [Nonomuraea aridisoli]|uniref:hypothetical protein n=1 Tax=Nonomuraea aridisoli TaxID=2070368 RepID=UPI0015E8D21A|nr:hypothetical protein [Nonomuraea aridisoli]
MDSYSSLPFPWTALTLNAVRFVQDLEEPAIFNHSMPASSSARPPTAPGPPGGS